MALLVLVVLSLAAFLRVESMGAVARQSAAAARLNALAAVRLAQAAVQQSLGPDTRISAPASLYDDPAVLSATTPGADAYEYPLLGAWRSWEGLDHDSRPSSRYAGRPQRPDYASKLRRFDAANPSQGRFLGWLVSSGWGYGDIALAPDETARPPKPASVIAATGTVPLVGAGTASLATQQVHLVPLSLADGRPVSVSGTAPLTAEGSQGAFAWWVGGENQKVRVAFPAAASTTNKRELSERLSTYGRPDLGALGFGEPSEPLAALASRRSLALLPADATRLSRALTEATPVPLTRAGFHDVTFVADGLLTNAATGGFRKDLSLLTETWDQMNDLDPSRSVALPLFRVRPATGRRTASAAPTHDLAFLRPLPDALLRSRETHLFAGNRRRHTLLYWWSDYGSAGGRESKDPLFGAMAGDGGTPFGGYWQLSSFPPIRSWAYLTDFALHYRRYVVSGDSDGLSGPIEMMPPTPQAGGDNATNAGRFYGLYERVHRHPLVARYQFVFAGAAVGDNPAILVQPVVTLWNPYNVRLTVPAFLTKAYPIYLPLAFDVTMTDPAGGVTTLSRNFSQWIPGHLAGTVGTGPMTFEPGQTRVFSIAPTGGPLASYRTGAAVPPQVLAPGYVAAANAGILLDTGVAAPAGSTLAFRLRKALSAGAGDSYRNGIYFDFVPANAEEAPVRYSFEGLDDSLYEELYGANQPAPWSQSLAAIQAAPRFFGAFSFGARLSDDGVAQYSSRTGVRTVSKGFLQANPFTNYTELGRKSAYEMTVFPWASANVASDANQPVGDKIRYSSGGYNLVNMAHFSAANPAFTYSGALNLLNAPFDLDFRVLTGPTDAGVPQTDAGQGYVVTGLDAATGLSRAVIAELPVRPLVSLLELQSCDLRFTNPVPPYMTNLVGNSDASPVLPPDDVVGPWITQDGVRQPRDMIPAAHMQYDDSYCLNHVLLDDWFVSSLAPRPADRAALRPAAGNEHRWNPAVMTSLKAAWSEFASGATPLPNVAYAPQRTAAAFAVDTLGDPSGGSATPAIPVAFLRVASHLRVTDQFNVNSLSVPAWRALLGSLRAREVPVLAPGAASVSVASAPAGATAPLPRMQVAGEGAAVAADPSRAVTGFASLTDEQLDRLAAEIVAQVRLRGPFLSLAEFVNRRLAEADGTATDPSLAGAVGMALRKLEADLAKPAIGHGKAASTRAVFAGTRLLGPGPDGRPLLALGEFTRADGDYAHPKAAEGNSNFGLPGWPRQADVLRSLAPIMAVRDDTVVVRAHGASVLGGGAGRAWCEVVLVRTPEYVDARIPAHEPPLGDAVSTGTAGLPNVALGRRYRVAAFRWLNPDEL